MLRPISFHNVLPRDFIPLFKCYSLGIAQLLGCQAQSAKTTYCLPYFNCLKRKCEAPGASSFVGDSMAMLLL